MRDLVCWGDSLTAGAAGNGITYPAVLQQWIEAEFGNVTVHNQGVGGETTNTILGRSGAVPFMLAENLRIPADKTPVQVRLGSQSGRYVAPLRQGRHDMHVTIGEIGGTLAAKQTSIISDDLTYWFTRDEEGAAVTVPVCTTVITEYADRYRACLPVIFMGANGGYIDSADLAKQQLALADLQAEGYRDHYLVVGLHTGSAESQAEMEQTMFSVHGNRYINLRAYMSECALHDLGMTPTSVDRERMQQGITPTCLLADKVHFNAIGYSLLGRLVFQRWCLLGYYNE